MAIAKQSLPSIRIASLASPRRIKIAAAAAILAALCGLVAFFILVLHDRGHPRIMFHEQHSARSTPSPATVAAPAAALTAAAPTSGKMGASQPSAVPVPPGQMRTEFHLPKVGGPVVVGSVQLKLGAIDLAKETYDLRVVSGRRSFTYRRLKLHQPLWISAGRKKGSLQLVATALETDGVAGYWKESSRSAHVSSRSRSKHR